MEQLKKKIKKTRVPEIKHFTCVLLHTFCERQILIKRKTIKDITLHTFSFWHRANNRGNELAHLCALQTIHAENFI